MKSSKMSILLLFTVGLLSGCGGNQQEKYPIKTGLSMDTLRAARWAHDRDVFTEKCNEQGVGVLVQSADSNDALQNSQAENLLTQGIKCMVVIPHNAKSSATIVESCHKMGVPVLSYDRLILDSDVDAYVSFDNIKVGELQASTLVKLKPTGNYVLMGGAPTDYNAILFRKGQTNVLDPLVKKGDIKIVGDQWADDWLAVNALKKMENILTKNDNKVDAVVDSYDGTAGGDIQALTEQGLAGKVLVSGQDAELAGCQRIVAGTQTMTVYKPVKFLAAKAADIAVDLAKGQALPATDKTTNNGKKDVPSYFLDPIPVTKDNLVATVIADGFQKMEEVYKDVPKDQWPKP
ncbi:MAG TPA: D-xylose ABC transporter substrate-binding protein [bacterium]|jgi:D-xylose transport system substrate-binding protein|nr:D-xylose ABC transporter substrate-binding protein [bacterium]